jgi:predicted RecA/RadA family phage recombinase
MAKSITTSMKFVGGKQRIVQRLSTGAVKAGSVVVTGSMPSIVVADIAAGAVGNFSDGGGVYETYFATETPTPAGTSLWWDGVSGGATIDTAGFAHLGVSVEATKSPHTVITFRHAPQCVTGPTV